MSDVCFRIYTTNYLDPDVLANAIVSSEHASFPVSNIYNKQRRSKVWRSNGHFEVTSSNNKIVFDEGSGELTATIIEGDYASLTAFYTAVEDALELAGAHNYTVTHENLRMSLTDNTDQISLKLTNVNFTAYDIMGFDNTADKGLDSNHQAENVRIHTDEWLK